MVSSSTPRVYLALPLTARCYSDVMLCQAVHPTRRPFGT